MARKINGVDYGYKKGNVPPNKGKSKTKVGDVYTSVGGYGDYIITSYIDQTNVGIRFLDSGWEDTVWASASRNGKVKDYLKPIIYGVGFNTMGKLYGKSTNPKLKKAKEKWMDMLERCYCENKRKDNPTYETCVVAEEWYNFANFWEWYDHNCDTEDKLKFHLDKDFIFKGNKIYGPNNCFLVPRVINNLVTGRLTNKDSDTPTGVHLHKSSNKYQTYYNDLNNKRHSLGFYDTAEEAFNVYKSFKEPVIKEAAVFYKDVIDERLYEILINYELKFEERY